MSRYIVTSKLGEKSFTREEDATDYQIKILTQAGIRSEVKEKVMTKDELKSALETAIAVSSASDYDKGNILYLAEQYAQAKE